MIFVTIFRSVGGTPDFMSPLQLQWPANSLISTQWTMQSGASCRSKSNAHESVMSTTTLSN